MLHAYRYYLCHKSNALCTANVRVYISFRNENVSLLETFYYGTYGTLGNFSECYCRGERTIVIDVYVL